jgi:hypothetical protein
MVEIKFKAENGEILIARDEIQALAFKNVGLEEVVEKASTKKTKVEIASE